LTLDPLFALVSNPEPVVPLKVAEICQQIRYKFT
jgi:hypothetical protein